VGQDDGGLDRPHQGRHAPDVVFGVEDAEIRRNGRVPLESHTPAGRLGLVGTGFGGDRSGEGRTSEVSVGEVAIVDIPPSITQQQQGSSGSEFDVVRMGKDGQDCRHCEILPSAMGFDQSGP